MESASVANDAFPVTYALAAVVLAIRAGERNNTKDFLISLLAIALATGVKQTIMPLGLLWIIAALPQWRLALARPAMTFIAVVLGLLISAVPITIANIKYTGNWTGWSAVSTRELEWNVRLSSPLVGIVGNAFYLPVQNLEPPFFPLSGAWNRLMERFLNTSLGAHFQSFDGFGALSPGISESSAGIGLAVVLMTMISIWATVRFRGLAQAGCSSRLQWALRLAPWFLLLIFMGEDGTVENARHLAPYYVFLFPVILIAGGQELLTRKIWWQKTALVCMATAVGLLIVNINRPLFPATTLLARAAASRPNSKSIAVLQEVYGTPSELENLKSNLLRQLPSGQPILGFAGEGNVESEPTLWQPWGSRTVEWVLPQDTPEQLQERGIHFVVIENYPDPSRTSVEAWMKRYHAQLLADIPFKKNGHHNESSHIYITRLDPP
jgi:hypothetical protein